MWLHLPFRKIPVSRHPPIKLEQKVALCAANKNQPSPSCFRVPNFRLSLPGFSLLLFALCLERTSSIFSQSLRGESAPLAKLLTNSKMTLRMTESVEGQRLPRDVRWPARRDNNDLAKMLRAIQIVTTWHDADVHGDKRQHFARHIIWAQR